jgi:hypothetical protein
VCSGPRTSRVNWKPRAVPNSLGFLAQIPFVALITCRRWSDRLREFFRCFAAGDRGGVQEEQDRRKIIDAVEHWKRCRDRTHSPNATPTSSRCPRTTWPSSAHSFRFCARCCTRFCRDLQRLLAVLFSRPLDPLVQICHEVIGARRNAVPASLHPCGVLASSIFC